MTAGSFPGRINHNSTLAPAVATVDKPYHSKRPHKKSRTGCKSCKQRKVKCDEGKPACRACTLRHEKCIYPEPRASEHKPLLMAGPSPRSRARTAAPFRGHDDDGPAPFGGAPGLDLEMSMAHNMQHRASGVDQADLTLLWFYTTATYASLSSDAKLIPLTDDLLKIRLFDIAFRNPFLMHGLLGLAASHLHHLGVPYEHPPLNISAKKALFHQSMAYEGCRKAIGRANPETYPALLACSLLFCALSSHVFREANPKPFYIMDWMEVWRGIRIIVQLITDKWVVRSGFAALFFRPPVDLEAASYHVPSYLLHMLSAVPPDDENDLPHLDDYAITLRFLGSLYQELKNGLGSVLDLRTVVFFTFLPPDMVRLLHDRRPRALVIMAHYLAFVKLIRTIWWVQGICEAEMDNILAAIPQDLAATDPRLVNIPRGVHELGDPASYEARLEMGRVLLEDPSWQPPNQCPTEHHESHALKPRPPHAMSASPPTTVSRRPKPISVSPLAPDSNFDSMSALHDPTSNNHNPGDAMQQQPRFFEEIGPVMDPLGPCGEGFLFPVPLGSPMPSHFCCALPCEEADEEPAPNPPAREHQEGWIAQQLEQVQEQVYQHQHQDGLSVDDHSPFPPPGSLLSTSSADLSHNNTVGCWTNPSGSLIFGAEAWSGTCSSPDWSWGGGLG